MLKKFLKAIYQWYRYATSAFRKQPDFLIIGAQKGGTSSLFYYLQQHPQVELSRIKEVHFFDNNFTKGIAWYKSFFPFKWNLKNKITGEASPYYLFHPDVPARVHALFPGIKLIALLRDPLDRAYSHYQMEIRKGREKVETFEEAITLEDKRIADDEPRKNLERKSASHQYFSYLARGKYYEQVEQWLQYFSREQILFIKSEDFFANPQHELDRVYSFLNLANKTPENLKPRNVGGKYPPVSAATAQYLHNYFDSSNQQLQRLLGENFSWNIKTTE